MCKIDDREGVQLIRRLGANAELTAEHLNGYLNRDFGRIEGMIPLEPYIDRLPPVKGEEEILQAVRKLTDHRYNRLATSHIGVHPDHFRLEKSVVSQLGKSSRSQSRYENSVLRDNESVRSREDSRSYYQSQNNGLMSNSGLLDSGMQRSRSQVMEDSRLKEVYAQNMRNDPRNFLVSKPTSIKANKHEVMDAHIIGEVLVSSPTKAKDIDGYRESKVQFNDVVEYNQPFGKSSYVEEYRDNNKNQRKGMRNPFIQRLENINERLRKITEIEEQDTVSRDIEVRSLSPDKSALKNSSGVIGTGFFQTSGFINDQLDAGDNLKSSTNSVRSVPQPAYEFNFKQGQKYSSKPNLKKLDIEEENIVIQDNVPSPSLSQKEKQHRHYEEWKGIYGIGSAQQPPFLRQETTVSQTITSPSKRPSPGKRQNSPKREQHVTQPAMTRQQQATNATVLTCCYDIIILKREIEEILSKIILTMQSNLYNMYQTFKRRQDANFLTKRDLQFMLSKLGLECSVLHSDLLYDILDYGKDGVVCFSDFERILLPKDPNTSNVAKRSISMGFPNLEDFGEQIVNLLRTAFSRFIDIAETLHVMRRDYWRELKSLRYDAVGDFKRSLAEVAVGYGQKKQATEDEIAYIRNLLVTC